MNTDSTQTTLIVNDSRFKNALKLFNNSEWYLAHDLFEELWHETSDPERTTLQALLQIAVAQLHLDRGNKVGAIILYGEGIGRLNNEHICDLGLDITKLCNCVEQRLKLLQNGCSPDICSNPYLSIKESNSF